MPDKMMIAQIDQAKSIFDNNDDYQTRDRYYRQDVIRNPGSGCI
ncbi:MAG: hypothetical protein ACLS9T_08205 [Streptococcus salivarius]